MWSPAPASLAEASSVVSSSPILLYVSSRNRERPELVGTESSDRPLSSVAKQTAALFDKIKNKKISGCGKKAGEATFSYKKKNPSAVNLTDFYRCAYPAFLVLRKKMNTTRISPDRRRFCPNRWRYIFNKHRSYAYHCMQPGRANRPHAQMG